MANKNHLAGIEFRELSRFSFERKLSKLKKTHTLQADDCRKLHACALRAT